LDAGFFYQVEADAANLKTVPLVATQLAAEYTVAILNRAPHEAAAKAFVKFLLGAQGQKILKEYGVTPMVPAQTFRAP
ncbi:MAG: extracellular solute-binding protein, partial [Acidimicrobiales bacterium]